VSTSAPDLGAAGPAAAKHSTRHIWPKGPAHHEGVALGRGAHLARVAADELEAPFPPCRDDFLSGPTE
jgi:hypothetical protein